MSRAFHHFAIDLAKEFGIPAATILENLIQLQVNHELAGDEAFYFHERWWVRHTPDSLSEWHPYLSADQVERVLRKLIKQGVIAKTTDPTRPFDRTSYWSVDGGIVHSAKSRNGLGEIAESHSAKTRNVKHNNNILTNTNNSTNRAVRFQRPALADVQEFFEDNGSDRHTAADFHDFYESKGWKVGKNSMKDWRAAARRWIRTNDNQPQVTRVGATRTRDIPILDQLNDTSWAE